MNTEQINFISSLDPEGINGTIQTVLFHKDLDKLDFTTTLQFLLDITVKEKAAIVKEQKKLIQFIKDKGLDISEVEV